MVEDRDYSIAVKTSLGFEEAKRRTTEALAAEGFGILTEIDVKATMKKKLDADFRDYAILGACNPPLAHRALSEEADLGVMLPCNCIVYANEDGGSTVAAIDPRVQFSKVRNPLLAPVAEEVRARLRRALGTLEGA